jgi:hypothetical protein
MSCKFQISNLVKNDVYLTRAFSSCGCTVVDFKPQKLPAGKTIEIEYFLDASQKFHHFKVPIFIEAMFDNKLLRKKGNVTGFMEVYYEFLPKKLSFSDLEQFQYNSDSEIVIKPLTDKAISITSITSDNNYVSLKTTELADAIKIKCLPLFDELKRGIWEDTIRIELDVSKTAKEIFSIPVTIEKGGNLTIMPTRIFYGFVRLGKKYNKSIVVQSRKDKIDQLSLLRKPEKLNMSFNIIRITQNKYKIDCFLQQTVTFLDNAIKDEICFLVNGEEYYIPAYAILTTE